MWCMHKWGGWIEEEHNKKVWVHDKRVYRYCAKCGEAESKVIRIDCTSFRRTGKYCRNCLVIINENRTLANVHILEYNGINLNTTTMAGRKPNIEMIKKVQGSRSKGVTYRDIQKITGHTLRILHFWSHYPLDKAEKRIHGVRA